VARDGTDLGAIEVSGKREGAFTASDERALEDLARIASLAIENARLEQRERNIARTLQDSLLPRVLPEIRGLQAEARYLPGGEGTLVGGDLYDLFAVEDEWALVVGDVCGKGAEAAALTAMVRYTVRAESLHHSSPGEVLGLLNEAILRQLEDGRFCTAIHGRLTVGAGGARISLANAGHPAPLVLRADGRVETVACSGPLLGVLPAVVHPDVIVQLRAGDALVCFTDGVTEGRGEEGMYGDERLAALLAACVGEDAAGIADRIVEDALAFQGGRTQDDLALLVLRVP
jgi:serine phosphatase RsbU (regulator of sigma subunit)